MKIAESMIENSFGTYIRSKPNTLKELPLIQSIDNYKKNIAKTLIPITSDVLEDISKEKSLWNIGKNVYVSKKIDGESTFYVYEEKTEESKSFFCNAGTYRVYLGLKASEDLEEIMKSKGIRKAIIPGELFAVSTEPPDFEERSFIKDFISYSRKPSSQEELDRIGFRAFDLIQLNEDDSYIDKKYEIRYEKLKGVLPEQGRIALVDTVIMNDHDISSFYDEVVIQKGAEGLVIRNSINFKGYKVKPVHNLDAVIIGVSEGRKGSRLQSDQLATSLLALRYPDGTYQVISKCGGGLSDDQRREIWNMVEFANSRGFIEATTRGAAYRMVKPQLIAQINYLDISTHGVDNEPVMQNTLRYDEENNEWIPLRPVPFMALISPRFVRSNPIRDDKTIDSKDVRLEQITDIIGIETPDKIIEIKLEKSEIIARYVFEKDESVRKFVAWKTNKHLDDPLYPEFVIFNTDYSPNRKVPLERKIRVTNGIEEVWGLLDWWIQTDMLNTSQDGLKKGWIVFDIKDTRKKPLELPI